ncbi:MAG: flagellin, partial [Synergistaceae bacterium]|nr:flagellin [Synergistaceae bacterium]
MVINHNIPALTTYGIVNNTSNSLEKSIQKLSTGLRINSAADDAAGLSISEKMRAQIGGLDRAVANAQDGVSLIQTAEGALTETHSILQRMRELSVQAANDTLTQQDRSYIQEEVDLLRDEIDHIGNTTTFNTKKLLNGDSAVLWSSDKLSTKAIVNGGLREIDQFGQKKSFEGNFKIAITATPGQAEIQKSDIMKVKHLGAGTRYDLTSSMDGIVSRMDGEGLEDGIDYKIASIGATAATPATGATQQAAFAKNDDSIIKNAAFVSSTVSSGNWNLAFEVTEVSPDGSASAATYAKIRVTGFSTAADGTVTDLNKNPVEITLTTTDAGAQGSTITNIAGSGLEIINTYATRANILTLTVGDKAVFNGAAGIASGSNNVGLSVKYTDPNENETTQTYNLSSGAFTAGGKTTLSFMDLDETTGELSARQITVTIDEDFTAGDLSSAKDIGTVRNYVIGDVAQDNVKLRDLDKFWDSQGNFMLDDPQTITINQGNGKTAKVTLYGHDTLGDVAKKLNEAIGTDLGQNAYVNDEGITKDKLKGVNHFVNFVNQAVSNSSESVEGTFLIRSLVPGTDGTLRFASKNEDLINALSLNTIQDAKESTYKVSITDAHTGESVVKDTTITGNKLIGTLHPNIDVEFDAMSGIKATWDDNNKEFKYDPSEKAETILHLADNTLTFQIGANEGDDMGINIGDMRSHALGLDSVLVTDRDSASRSITVIDNAIDKVSTQRAKLGAYQNRLEHTMTNLETSSENLSAAESRIRDTDMAKEMMNFTKLNIMLQAGNSMLAQANQLPQNV